MNRKKFPLLMFAIAGGVLMLAIKPMVDRHTAPGFMTPGPVKSKKQLPDGRQVITFENGDVKIIHPNGRIEWAQS